MVLGSSPSGPTILQGLWRLPASSLKISRNIVGSLSPIGDIMASEDEGNFQLKVMKVEHALRKVGGDEKYYGCAACVQNLVVKFVPKDKQIEFMDELSDLILNKSGR